MSVGRKQDPVRKWPIVTIALIAINVALFLITHRILEEQRPQIAEVKVHILMLAAAHPGLDISPDVRVFISNFSEQNPDSWGRLQRGDRPSADEWDERTRAITNEDTLQQEMESLVGQYQSFQNTAFGERYAFTPLSPAPLAYVTASFLHSSWRMLIAAMLALLLAGCVLEDAWGRVIFPAFYLAAGAVAMQIHVWTNPSSLAPAMGAAGAVSVLMGAVLVRFPARKLRLGAVGFPAVCVAPLWLATETFVHWKGVNRDYAPVFERPDLRVYATSVCAAFIFGAAVAIVFRYLRVERHQSETGRSRDRRYAEGAATIEAEQLIEDGDNSAAEALLKDALKINPYAVDALVALQQLYYRTNEMSQYQAVTVTLCRAYLKERDSKAAWQAYEEFLNSGGQDMPSSTWVELARVAEEMQLFERAVSECEKIIALYPNTRESLMAQLRAARILLKQLERPGQALKMFEAARSSPFPHLDFEQAIETGIRQSRVAISMAGSIPVTD